MGTHHSKPPFDPSSVSYCPAFNRPVPFSLKAHVFIDQFDSKGNPLVPKIEATAPDTMPYIGASPVTNIPIALPHIVKPGVPLTFTVLFFASWQKGTALPPPTLTWNKPWDGFTHFAQCTVGGSMGYLSVAESPFALENWRKNQNNVHNPYYTYQKSNSSATSNFDSMEFVAGETLITAGLYGENFSGTGWMRGERAKGAAPVKGGLKWHGIGPNLDGTDNKPYSTYSSGAAQLAEVKAWKPMCTLDSQVYGTGLSGYDQCEWWTTCTFVVDPSVNAKLMDPWTDKLLLTRYNLDWPAPANWNVNLTRTQRGYPANTNGEFVYKKYPFYITDGTWLKDDAPIGLYMGGQNIDSTDPGKPTIVQWGTVDAVPGIAANWTGPATPGRYAYLFQFIPTSMLKADSTIDPKKYDASKVLTEFLAVKQVVFIDYLNAGVYIQSAANASTGQPGQWMTQPQWMSTIAEVVDPEKYSGSYLVKMVLARYVTWPTPGINPFYIVGASRTAYVTFIPQPTDFAIVEMGSQQDGVEVPFPSTGPGRVLLQSEDIFADAKITIGVYAKIKQSATATGKPPQQLDFTIDWGAGTDLTTPKVGQAMPFIVSISPFNNVLEIATDQDTKNKPLGDGTGTAVGRFIVSSTGNNLYPCWWFQEYAIRYSRGKHDGDVIWGGRGAGLRGLFDYNPVAQWGQNVGHHGDDVPGYTKGGEDPIGDSPGENQYGTSGWMPGVPVGVDDASKFPTSRSFTCDEIAISSSYGWCHPYSATTTLLRGDTPTDGVWTYTGTAAAVVGGDDLDYQKYELHKHDKHIGGFPKWRRRPWTFTAHASHKALGIALHGQRMTLKPITMAYSGKVCSLQKDVLGTFQWTVMSAYAAQRNLPPQIYNMPYRALIPVAIGDTMTFEAPQVFSVGDTPDIYNQQVTPTSPTIVWVPDYPLHVRVKMPSCTYTVSSSIDTWTMTVDTVSVQQALSGSSGHFEITLSACVDPLIVKASFMTMSDVDVSKPSKN